MGIENDIKVVLERVENIEKYLLDIAEFLLDLKHHQVDDKHDAITKPHTAEDNEDTEHILISEHLLNLENDVMDMMALTKIIKDDEDEKE